MQITESLAIEWWPADQVRPYPGNPRKITAAAIDKVAASIRQYGWRQPIVVDQAGVIIVGHTRHKAAQQLGLARVPIHIAVGMSEEEIRAYRIADNRTGEESQWDLPALDGELRALEAAGFDLALTAFDFDQWPVPPAPLADPDRIVSPPEEPITQLGDLWLVGNHRVLCGDSTDAEAVSRLLEGVVPALMVTDPPYGVNYDPNWRAWPGHQVRQTGKVLNDDRADWREAWELFPGHVAYIWHASMFGGVVQQSLEACGFEIRSQIIWAKDRFALSRGNYHWKHEACWYAVRKGKRANWRGSRRQATVWEIEGAPAGVDVTAVLKILEEQGAEPTLWRIPVTVDDGATGHGTQKPVECMRRPIRNNSRPGDGIYDPFLGSGSTLIAAELEQRRCYGLELNPAYCDVIVKRWEMITGQTAVRRGQSQE